jgi:glycosyltransferase involved in cell wall biosynthesis
MKVLHVIPYMHPQGGGPPVVVDRVCHELKQAGVEADILTTDLYTPDGNLSWKTDWLSHEQMEIQPVTKQRPYADSPKLRSVFRKSVKHYDLVHLHTLWSYCSRVVKKYCRRRGIPYVVMPHGMLDPASLQRKRFKKAIYGKLVEYPILRSAAGLICTHLEEERLARESVSGLPAAYITPLGADDPPTDRETLRKEFYERYPEYENHPMVVFLSRLHEKKGLDLLIPAFKTVVESYPDAHLLIIGSGDRMYESDLRNLVRRNRINDNVTMTGHLGGRWKWQAMAAGDVFILPSYQENFALVVVDALNLGLPVILSNRVNICSEVVDAGAGLECELNPQHIAEQLTWILSSDDACVTMGQWGRELVQREFTWKRCAERTLAAYETILDACHSTPEPI